MKNKNLDELHEKISKFSCHNNKCNKHSNIESNTKEAVNVCFRRIVILTYYRERCEFELKERLVDKEDFKEDIFIVALEKAKKYNIVNDERYAEMYSYSRSHSHRGTQGIEFHFKKMHIDFESMPSVVENLNAAKMNELKSATEFLESHPSRSKNKFAGCVRKLINRGYDSNIAISATRKYLKIS